MTGGFDDQTFSYPYLCMDRFSIGHEFPVHFFLKKGKVTKDQYFLLVELTHTQLCLVVVLKFSPIRAQAMGICILY